MLSCARPRLPFLRPCTSSAPQRGSPARPPSREPSTGPDQPGIYQPARSPCGVVTAKLRCCCGINQGVSSHNLEHALHHSSKEPALCPRAAHHHIKGSPPQCHGTGQRGPRAKAERTLAGGMPWLPSSSVHIFLRSQPYWPAFPSWLEQAAARWSHPAPSTGCQQHRAPTSHSLL